MIDVSEIDSFANITTSNSASILNINKIVRTEGIIDDCIIIDDTMQKSSIADQTPPPLTQRKLEVWTFSNTVLIIEEKNGK